MRVLLDQNYWVGLARAAAGKSNTQVESELLELLRILRASGHCFPLTSARYYETLKMNKYRHRMDLAMLMEELSGFETLLPPEECVYQEFVAELACLSGKNPPNLQDVLGHGFNHALRPEWVHPSLKEYPEAIRPKLRERANAVEKELYRAEEFKCLTGHEASDRAQLRQVFASEERKFEQAESGIKAHLRGLFRGQVDKAELVFRAETITYFKNELKRAALSLEIEVSEASELLTGNFSRGLENVPGIDVLSALRAQHYRDANRVWSGNDHLDVKNLMHGIPYCDVVATDKAWADLVSRTGKDKKYQTKVVGKSSTLLKRLSSI